MRICAPDDDAVAECAVLSTESDLERECAALCSGGVSTASSSLPLPLPAAAAAAPAAEGGAASPRKVRPGGGGRLRTRTRRRRIAIDSSLWARKSVFLQSLVLHHLESCDDVYFVSTSDDVSLKMWLAS